MTYRTDKPQPERFWLDERVPSELYRRADDLERDGLSTMAWCLRERARQLEKGGRDGKA